MLMVQSMRCHADDIIKHTPCKHIEQVNVVRVQGTVTCLVYVMSKHQSYICGDALSAL